MIGDAGFHCRSDAQRLVHTVEVVVRKMQTKRGPEILPFLAKAIGQPRQAADRHPHCEVLALDVRGADFVRIGIAQNRDWNTLH